MYRCDECEALFSEPQTALKESTVPYGICPNCGADIYEEVARCDMCGEWREAGDVRRISGQLICETCLEKVKDILGRLTSHTVETVAEAYGLERSDVRDLLREIMED